MQRYHLSSLQETIIPHSYCYGKVIGIEGAFELYLDELQLDDLSSNGYTMATETCRYCGLETMLILTYKASKTKKDYIV